MAAVRRGDNILNEGSDRIETAMPRMRHDRLDVHRSEKTSDTDPTASYDPKRSEATMRGRQNESKNNAVCLEARCVKRGGLAPTRVVTTNRCVCGARARDANAIMSQSGESARVEWRDGDVKIHESVDDV